MANKKGLLEMLKAAVEAAGEASEPKTKKIKIGRVDQAMIERVREIDERHDRQHDELKEQAEAFVDQVHNEAEAKIKAYVEQLEKDHRPDCRKAKQEMAAAWDDIHDLLGLPESERATNYNLNAITGDITKEVPVEQDQSKEKVFH